MSAPLALVVSSGGSRCSFFLVFCAPLVAADKTTLVLVCPHAHDDGCSLPGAHTLSLSQGGLTPGAWRPHARSTTNMLCSCCPRGIGTHERTRKQAHVFVAARTENNSARARTRKQNAMPRRETSVFVPGRLRAQEETEPKTQTQPCSCQVPARAKGHNRVRARCLHARKDTTGFVPGACTRERTQPGSCPETSTRRQVHARARGKQKHKTRPCSVLLPARKTKTQNTPVFGPAACARERTKHLCAPLAPGACCLRA